MDKKLEKQLKDAQGKVAQIEAKQADLAAQLDTARAALASAESEHDAALAAAGLGEAADVNRARRALDAALRRLDREREAALGEVQGCEKAVLAAQVADLDSEGMALYRQTVKALTELWRTHQAAVDAGKLRAYDAAKNAGLRSGNKSELWRTLLSFARESGHMLTLLERADPKAFAEAGGVTERERAYWIQGVRTLQV